MQKYGDQSKELKEMTLAEYKGSAAENIQVYNERYTNWGSLPSLDSAVISSGGARVYMFVTNASTLHTVDLLHVDVQNDFLEIGAGTKCRY